MKLLLLFALFLTISTSTFAQKPSYDKKTNEVTVEGEHVFNLIRTCDGGQNCRFDVYDLSGKKVIRINLLSFKSPVEISESNPNGTVHYSEFIFLESEQKAESSLCPYNPKRFAKVIVDNNLMQNGKLNEEAMNEFILTNGTRFSERVKF